MSDAPQLQADVAVVGAGGAGLYAALSAAAEGARVVLVSATPLARTASYWAQGGIAAALAPDDSPDLHRHDTEVAGRGLVRPSAAAVLCREAARIVADLERLGVVFDLDPDGGLALGLEGGHSKRRVVHAGGSATGRRVVRQLSALVAEDPHIHVLEQARAATVWRLDGRCVGLVCEDGRAIAARGVVLATGGAAALWSRTTNPPGSVGIGALLARAAGAAIADLEHMDRARYAGPVGWMDGAGDGEWGIALRCGAFDADDPRRMRLFAGCGIVAGSEPEAELAESDAKFVPMRDALTIGD